MPAKGENPAKVAARVLAARERQQALFDALGAPAGVRMNVQADGELLARIAPPDANFLTWRLTGCGFRREDTTGCSVWRARLPIFRAQTVSPARISPKH